MRDTAVARAAGIDLDECLPFIALECRVRQSGDVNGTDQPRAQTGFQDQDRFLALSFVRSLIELETRQKVIIECPVLPISGMKDHNCVQLAGPGKIVAVGCKRLWAAREPGVNGGGTGNLRIGPSFVDQEIMIGQPLCQVGTFGWAVVLPVTWMVDEYHGPVVPFNQGADDR